MYEVPIGTFNDDFDFREIGWILYGLDNYLNGYIYVCAAHRMKARGICLECRGCFLENKRRCQVVCVSLEFLAPNPPPPSLTTSNSTVPFNCINQTLYLSVFLLLSSDYINTTIILAILLYVMVVFLRISSRTENKNK